ncbi:5916_t:CDS:2, partial [Dentiscutata erythropus]
MLTLLDDGDETSSPEPPARQLRKRLPIQQAPYSIERIRARNAGIPTEVDSKVLKFEREQNFNERYNYEEQDDGFIVHDSDESNTFDNSQVWASDSENEATLHDTNIRDSLNSVDNFNERYNYEEQDDGFIEHDSDEGSFSNTFDNSQVWATSDSENEATLYDTNIRDYIRDSLNSVDNYAKSVQRNKKKPRGDTPFDRLLKTNLQWAKETPVPSIDDPLFKKYTPIYVELFNQLTFAVPFNQSWPLDAEFLVAKLIRRFKNWESPNNSNIEEPYKILCVLVKNFPKGRIPSIPEIVDVFYILTKRLVRKIKPETPRIYVKEFQAKNFKYVNELFQNLDNKNISYYKEAHEKMCFILEEFMDSLSPRDDTEMLLITLNVFEKSLSRLNKLTNNTKAELTKIHRNLVAKFDGSDKDAFQHYTQSLRPMLSDKRLEASDLQVPFIYSIQQNSSNTASGSQAPFICPIQQNSKHTLSYEISATSGLQVLSVYPIEQSSQPMLNDEILPTFNSQVLFDEQSSQLILSDEILPVFSSEVPSVYSIEQSLQPMLNNEILPASSSQVPSICSIPQRCASSEPDMLNANDVENEFVNYDISDINERQKIEVKDQEKLEIVSGSIFQTWEQLDRHIKMYAKQNGFVSIITCSEYDDITRRRCRYACEHQGIGHSKKTAILENQKESHTKRLGCKWVVNATCPKTNKKIKINSCYLEHSNHEIYSDTINFASYYRQFPDEVKQEIKYYTSKGLNMRTQLSLLEDKYPDVIFLPKDLSSTIQSFKNHNK